MSLSRTRVLVSRIPTPSICGNARSSTASIVLASARSASVGSSWRAGWRSRSEMPGVAVPGGCCRRGRRCAGAFCRTSRWCERGRHRRRGRTLPALGPVRLRVRFFRRGPALVHSWGHCALCCCAAERISEAVWRPRIAPPTPPPAAGCRTARPQVPADRCGRQSHGTVVVTRLGCLKTARPPGRRTGREVVGREGSGLRSRHRLRDG